MDHLLNSWFEFLPIIACGEIGPCSLSCCDMFTVQNVNFTVTPLSCYCWLAHHMTLSEIQAPSLSSCHLLIRTIPNMQKKKKISVRYKILAAD